MAYNRSDKYYGDPNSYYGQEDYYYYKNNKRHRKSYYRGDKQYGYYGNNWDNTGYKPYKHSYADYNNYKSAENDKHSGFSKSKRDHAKKMYAKAHTLTEVAQPVENLKTEDTKPIFHKNRKLEHEQRPNLVDNPYEDHKGLTTAKKHKRNDSFDYPVQKDMLRQSSNVSVHSYSSTSSKFTPQAQSFDHKNLHQNDEELPETNFELESNMTDSNLNDISCFSASVDGDVTMSTIDNAQYDDNSWKVSKFHNPSIYCLKNCSTWRLKIRKTHNPFAQKNKAEFLEKENFTKTFILSKVVAIRAQEVNVDFMQDLQEADNFTSIESPVQLDTGYEKQKEALSKVEGLETVSTENSSLLLDALFPINNENRAPEFCHLNANPENRENVIWVEFEIDPESDELKFLRELDQHMVESHIQFKLNGRIHTKNVLQKDLDFALNGKKIVKSVQNRLEHYANYLLKNKKNFDENYDQGFDSKAGLKTNKKEYYIKFINISQSFGVKIQVCPLESTPYQYKKPVNLLTANFNKIVKAGIRIRSFIFTFNIPNKDLVIKKEDINYERTLTDLELYSTPSDAYCVASVDLQHTDSSKSDNNQNLGMSVVVFT